MKIHQVFHEGYDGCDETDSFWFSRQRADETAARLNCEKPQEHFKWEFVEHETSDEPRDEHGEELDEIRGVFLHGADETLWPPGLTLAQAIKKIVASAATRNSAPCVECAVIGKANCPDHGESKSLIKCPFCHEDDFDDVGLKIHLQCHCESYRTLLVSLPVTRFQTEPTAMPICDQHRREAILSSGLRADVVPLYVAMELEVAKNKAEADCIELKDVMNRFAIASPESVKGKP